jgi:succinate dehydrogenase / fumarate reductase, iron-sulfur subunit
MTCYLPPITNPDAIYKVHILRFNPEADKEAHWETYDIPWVRTMTVIEGLEWLWDQGEYIAFRSNCREFTCGSCAMTINGKPSLACDTVLQDDMRIEPLSRYPVLKDLVVDSSSVPERYKELRLWPECNRSKDGGGCSSSKDWTIKKDVAKRYRETYSRCIECYCCLDACPASHSDQSPYYGPLYMLQLGRAMEHPADEADRVAEAAKESGMWFCINCYECASVCPMQLNPAEVVGRLRRKAMKRPGLLFDRGSRRTK